MDSNCKNCRRVGQKLFLKGDRCFSPKCAIVRKNYAPGQKHKKGRRKTASEYGLQLKEKQSARNLYGLREAQFRKYINEVMRQKAEGKSFADFLVEKLELRLDNAVFRMGLVNSRDFARQLVVHGHITVNGRRVDRPSFSLKIGDVVAIRAASKSKKSFQNLNVVMKKYNPPSWMSMDKEKIEAKVIGLPGKDEANIPANLQSISEFYSR